MFHSVSQQILEQLLESRAVCANCHLPGGAQGRIVRLNVVPAGLRERAEVDRFDGADVVAVAGEREEVVDECLTPLDGGCRGFDVFTVGLILSQFEAGLGHVQWVPEVVGDDARELLQTLVLSLQLSFTLLLG